jgi:integrase
MVTNGTGSPLVSTKTPSRATTLADVISHIQQRHALPPQRRHDLTSAVRTIARLLGQPPGDIEADPAAIRQRLVPFTAASAGTSQGRWKNLRSLFTAALNLAGVHVVRRRRRDALSPAWQELLSRISDHFERFRLGRLASHCSANNIVPEQVDDAVSDVFGAALLQHSLIERPKQVHREACQAWNRAAETAPGWPPVRLRVPQNRRDYALPVTAYPASFAVDLQAYLDHLAGNDLFAETARQPACPLTIHDNRLQLLQLAAALVLSGWDPTSICHLADLIEVDAARAALKFIWQRNGMRKTGQLHRFALLLVKLAKHWVKVSPEHLEALRQLRKQVNPGSSGMTARNRARLRQFDDPVNVARLVNLPETIMRRLAAEGRPTYNAAIRAQAALAIAIVLAAPLRVKNLAGLTLDRHFSRARPGPDAILHLVIPAHEVKNDSHLEFELPDAVRKLLDLYVTRFRPLLATGPSAFLFPARQGGAKPPGQLAGQIQRAIRHEIGLQLNVHLFRHLAAKLFLAAHPGEYETVRLLLGHKSLVTTVRSYCGLEQSDAIRRYDAVLGRHRADGSMRDVA